MVYFVCVAAFVASREVRLHSENVNCSRVLCVVSSIKRYTLHTHVQNAQELPQVVSPYHTFEHSYNDVYNVTKRRTCVLPISGPFIDGCTGDREWTLHNVQAWHIKHTSHVDFLLCIIVFIGR